MVDLSSQSIAEIRDRGADARGELLERFRQYLSVLARVQIGKRIQGKLDASDVVQETFLEAHRQFDRFQGATVGELIVWLRAILATRLADQCRRYLGTKGRDVRLEREFADGFAQSTFLLDHGLIADQSSPSEKLVRHEQALQLADALGQLPTDYRDIMILRHLEGLTFPQVAERLGKTLNSVEKLWIRALAQLRGNLGAQS